MNKARYIHTFLSAFAALTLLAACASKEENPQDGDGDQAPGVGELGGLCGGIGGFQCEAEGAYCEMEPGVCVNTADAAGVCVMKPEMCTRDYRPVCGCDGETYSNACTAASMGASIAYEGLCKEEE